MSTRSRAASRTRSSACRPERPTSLSMSTWLRSAVVPKATTWPMRRLRAVFDGIAQVRAAAPFRARCARRPYRRRDAAGTAGRAASCRDGYARRPMPGTSSAPPRSIALVARVGATRRTRAIAAMRPPSMWTSARRPSGSVALARTIGVTGSAACGARRRPDRAGRHKSFHSSRAENDEAEIVLVVERDGRRCDIRPVRAGRDVAIPRAFARSADRESRSWDRAWRSPARNNAGQGQGPASTGLKQPQPVAAGERMERAKIHRSCIERERGRPHLLESVPDRSRANRRRG